jgi:alkylated DNA nucleotide flippase Atl1
MEKQIDTVIDIPDRQIRFFGGSGKMLLPSRATVEALLSQIPEAKLMTTAHFRKKLADQFNVRGTCPVTTRKALAAIANDHRNNIPYWRLINQDGSLIASFPGGIEGHAQLLELEGFAVDKSAPKMRVKDFKKFLVQPDQVEMRFVD